MSRDPSRSVRWTLGALLAFVFLNALAGGIYGFRGARGVPLDLLRGTPFDSYAVPSLFLIVAVGGSALVASFGLFANSPWAPRSGLVAGLVLAGWMVAQLWMIGYVSWMQPTFVVIALVVLALTRAL